MKYTINLGGRGGDIYVYELNKEQKTQLTEGNVADPKGSTLNEEAISEILGVEFVDDSDKTYTGVYDDPSLMMVEVTNEEGEIVFDSSQSDKDWYFNLETLSEHEMHESVHNEGNCLFVENYCKGNFFIFEVETEYFNPALLSPICLQVGGRFNLIVGLCYDGEELMKKYDDYWSNGLYYYLN